MSLSFSPRLARRGDPDYADSTTDTLSFVAEPTAPAEHARGISRTTFCSHLAMQGAPMRGVQELLGHQSLAMMQRHSHVSPASLDATIPLLENRATLRAVGDSLEPPKGWNA